VPPIRLFDDDTVPVTPAMPLPQVTAPRSPYHCGLTSRKLPLASWQAVTGRRKPSTSSLWLPTRLLRRRARRCCCRLPVAPVAPLIQLTAPARVALPLFSPGWPRARALLSSWAIGSVEQEAGRQIAPL